MRPFRTDVKALTGGRGVDLVYDGVGGRRSQGLTDSLEITP